MSGGSNGYDPAKLGSQLGGKLTQYVNSPAPAPSVGTTSGISSLLGSANPAGYSQGVNGAISSFADTASGKNIGVEAPGYQAVRDRLRSDVSGDVNASVGSLGRTGSNVHIGSLTDALTSNLGALDMAQYNAGQDRQVEAAKLLPDLQQAATQPGLSQLMAGQVQDANADPNYSRFKELLGLFNNSQSSAGMKQETPWWEARDALVAELARRRAPASLGEIIMGLASLLLGKANPISQFVDSRQNTLGAWGAGLASGPSFQQGLSNAVQYGAQAAPLDQQAAEQRRAEEDAKASMNRTAEYLRSVPGGAPFADAIEKGGVDASTAFKGWFEFSQPKPPGALTSDIQNFLFGQENPGFLDYQTQKGGAAERSLTPTFIKDANGNIVPGQLDKAGNLVPSKMPEGYQAVDPFQMAGGKAGATVDAKTAAAARAAMRGAELSNINTAKAIADVRNNAAGMNEWFGQIGPRGMYINPGSAMGKFWAAAEPTNNQAFMQAREMLKNGGPITDFEGRKAEDAFSRMRAALEKGDQQQYLNALADFEESVAIGYQKLVETAQGGYSQGGTQMPGNAGGGNVTSTGVPWSIEP